MFKKIVSLWPLIFFILASILLRAWKLPEFFHFTYDESVFAFVGRRLFLWGHIPLIGGATPLGFHVAPYFYWFFAVILKLGNFNPIAWGYASAAFGGLTTLVIYLVAKNFYSKKVGITASILWAFSYLANIYDRHFWGLTFGPLFSLLVVFCLFQIIKGKEKFVYILGLILALIIHADLSFYSFLITTISAWVIFKIPVKKSTFIALAFILLSFLPLIVFDLRHNFANTKPFFTFLKSGRNTPGFNYPKAVSNVLLFPQAASRFVVNSSDNQISKEYSYCPAFASEKLRKINPVITVISALAIVAFLYLSINGKEIGGKLLSILLLAYFSGIQIYGTILKADIFEHYLSGLFAAFILITAYFICKLPKKLWLLAIGVFVFANLFKLSQAANSMGLTAKRQAIEYTMQKVGDKPFSLDSLSTCWKYSGYRYLFAVFGREPVKSYVDPNFAYLYGTTAVWDHHPQTVATFVIHDFVPETEEFYKRYALLKSHETSSSLFGNIEVIIMDNSTNWFEQPETLKNPNIQNVD